MDEVSKSNKESASKSFREIERKREKGVREREGEREIYWYSLIV